MANGLRISSMVEKKEFAAIDTSLRLSLRHYQVFTGCKFPDRESDLEMIFKPFKMKILQDYSHLTFAELSYAVENYSVPEKNGRTSGFGFTINDYISMIDRYEKSTSTVLEKIAEAKKRSEMENHSAMITEEMKLNISREQAEEMYQEFLSGKDISKNPAAWCVWNTLKRDKLLSETIDSGPFGKGFQLLKSRVNIELISLKKYHEPDYDKKSGKGKDNTIAMNAKAEEISMLNRLEDAAKGFALQSFFELKKSEGVFNFYELTN